MTALAAQYGDPACSTFVTNFTVIYLRFVVTLIHNDFMVPVSACNWLSQYYTYCVNPISYADISE